MHNLNIKSANKDYQVNFYSKINDLIKSITDEKIFYLIDENVHLLYKDYFTDKPKLIVPALEISKTLEYISNIFDHLIDKDFKTDVHLVVIGGGILQDLGGFVASIFCRGVKYTLVPTTLLAMCDSCIGGKTSINHHKRKNILGTFYPPDEIKISLEFLKTLDQKDLLSGYGELIKFYCLDNNIFNIDLENLEECIYYGLNKKSKIIQTDEFDKGLRKLLNFGHTFGHALESASNYAIPHGSAVIIGILIANEISTNLGYCSERYNTNVRDKLLPFINHLKLKKKWFVFGKLLLYIKSDKKNTGKDINMVLHNNGSYSIFPINDLEILKASLNTVYEVIRLRN
jgi:3-dehydroquinate synthase